MVKYVTQREFEIFKTMIKEKMFKNSKKPYELAELMIKGFERADKKIDELTEVMIKQFERADKRLDEQTELMMGQFDVLDGRIGKVEGKLDKVEKKIGKVEEKVDRGFTGVNSDLKLIKDHLGIK